jgi:hypothetical protein
MDKKNGNEKIRKKKKRGKEKIKERESKIMKKRRKNKEKSFFFDFLFWLLILSDVIYEIYNMTFTHVYFFYFSSKNGIFYQSI